MLQAFSWRAEGAACPCFLYCAAAMPPQPNARGSSSCCCWNTAHSCQQRHTACLVAAVMTHRDEPRNQPPKCGHTKWCRGQLPKAQGWKDSGRQCQLPQCWAAQPVSLVEGGIFLLGDLLRVTHPDGLLLVDQGPLMVDLLHLQDMQSEGLDACLLQAKSLPQLSSSDKSCVQ